MNTATPASKRGRKPKPFFFGGEYINGLRHKSETRWELADGRTFSERDEAKAVKRFRELMGESSEADAKVERLDKHIYADSERMWDFVATAIRERPIWAAQKLGIEQIAYLEDLKKPEPLPTFAELENLWSEKCECTADQRQKVLRAWKDFVSTMQLVGLRDITPEVAVDFKDRLKARDISKKQRQHLFAGIRRVLSFAKERAIAVHEIKKALVSLECLKLKKEKTKTNPKPIEVEEWQKLLAVAKGDDLALCLTMLNGGYYLADAIKLEWDSIRKGAVVGYRDKTGECIRAFTLWAETETALAAVARKGEKIFYSVLGQPLGIKGAQKRFKALATKAGVKVTAKQLRSGAASAAAEANVNTDIRNVLLGHSNGIDDDYVRRNPRMTKVATDAIYAHYFGQPPMKLVTAA